MSFICGWCIHAMCFHFYGKCFSQDQYYHHSTNIYWKYSDEDCHMHIKVILCISECMGVNGEALQLHAVYKNPYFLLQVM